LRELDVLGSANERFLNVGKRASLQSCGASAAVDKKTSFAKVGLVAVVEVFVGVAQLIQIVCSFGSLRIR
jgi:hypothetical protein